jgi:PIN domain
VIIFVDANAFVADPYCQGLAWRALVHATPAWHLRIKTTEVVFVEAVSKYERSIDARQKDMIKLSKSLGQLGLGNLLSELLAIVLASGEKYTEEFRKILSSCGVEVIEIPDIPHMDLVKRATSRRRPCDDNGNGYRDTLNWLVLLRAAEENPGEQIAWISDDTDFLASDGAGFHADLIDDLVKIDASERVFWCRTLKDLVLKLAAEKSINTGDDLRAVADQLQRNSITEYLAKQIIPGVLDSTLSAYRCGLPLETKSARLLGVTGMSDADVELTGSISRDQVLAQFSLQATANIEIFTEFEQSESDESSNSEDGQSESTVSKELYLRGIITLDSHGKPLTAEMSTIEAANDDPGRKKWEETLALSEVVENYATILGAAALSPDLFKNIAPFGLTLPPGYLKSIVPTLPPGYLKSIVPTLPPGYLKNIASNESSVDEESDSSDDDDSPNGEDTASGE